MTSASSHEITLSYIITSKTIADTMYTETSRAIDHPINLKIPFVKSMLIGMINNSLKRYTEYN